MAAARVGFRHTPETIARIAQKKRGHKYGPMSEERKRKISQAQIGKQIPESTRAIWRAQRKGRKPSEATRALLSSIRKGRSTKAWAHKVAEAQRGKPKHCLRGPNHHNWKGGGSKNRECDTRMWAYAVKRRDNYTCQMCGLHSKRGMEAHHIWSYAEFPSKRFDVDNGVTLCGPCHKRGRVHRVPYSLRDLLFGEIEVVKPNAV